MPESFALGIALISTQQSYARDLTSLLTGSILGVSRRDLYLTAAVGGMVILVILLTRRELSAIAFDRVFAESSGIRVGFYELLFLVLLSLTIVISLQTVGNLLVLAMLVTPAATARLLTAQLPVMVAVSATLGMFSGLAGLYLSYHFSMSGGAAIVLVATAIFGLVFLFGPRSGVVTTAVRRQLHFPHPERDTFDGTGSRSQPRKSRLVNDLTNRVHGVPFRQSFYQCTSTREPIDSQS